MLIKEENLRFILGLKIKQLRKKRNLSQSELAEKTEISVSYLNEIESGKKYPKHEKLFVLAGALDISYDELVSLRMDSSLQPIAELLKSNLLYEVPLEDFGIDVIKLFDLFSNAPVKASAFVNTFFEMIRLYDITIEDFYLSALRSYLEFKNNYFEDIEKIAEETRIKYFNKNGISFEDIKKFLEEEFHYRIAIDDFECRPHLHDIRSIYSQKKDENLIVLNKKQNERQMLFTLCREIGFQVLQLTDRSDTYPQLYKSNRFEEILNNYKARYFASALLLPEERLATQMRDFFSQSKWNNDVFAKLIASYRVTEETFLHRLTSILPSSLNLQSLFFLKIYHTLPTDSFHLVKELHLNGLHGPHAMIRSEHYCRRWISIGILNKLVNSTDDESISFLSGVQSSSYYFSNKTYFCISVARPMYPTVDTNCSLTIGFEENDHFHNVVKFSKDTAINRKMVGVTCERCKVEDCQERATIETVQDETDRKNKMNEVIKEYLGKWIK